MGTLLQSILFMGVFGTILFTLFRYNHYTSMRENGHDRYMVVKRVGDKKYTTCPDMNMFGLKFSVILFFVGLNFLMTLYILVTM